MYRSNTNSISMGSPRLPMKHVLVSFCQTSGKYHEVTKRE